MENPIFFEVGSTARKEYAKAYRYVHNEGIVAREADFIISMLQTPMQSTLVVQRIVRTRLIGA